MHKMHTMHIEDLSLTQIRLLAELYRLGSVSAASEKIGLSQPAASRASALKTISRQVGGGCTLLTLLHSRSAAAWTSAPFA
jgi:molybdenum-dependent DNA-binding transcriptional regulator ModE